MSLIWAFRVQDRQKFVMFCQITISVVNVPSNSHQIFRTSDRLPTLRRSPWKLWRFKNSGLSRCIKKWLYSDAGVQYFSTRLECARPMCNLSAEAEARLQKTFIVSSFRNIQPGVSCCFSPSPPVLRRLPLQYRRLAFKGTMIQMLIRHVWYYLRLYISDTGRGGSNLTLEPVSAVPANRLLVNPNSHPMCYLYKRRFWKKELVCVSFSPSLSAWYFV